MTTNINTLLNLAAREIHPGDREETMTKCVLCGALIGDRRQAHNAAPVAKGFCCTACNLARVLPAPARRPNAATRKLVGG